MRQITGEKSLKSRETSKDVCKKRDIYKTEGKKKKRSREGERKLEERSQVCNTWCLSDVARGRCGERKREGPSNEPAKV